MWVITLLALLCVSVSGYNDHQPMTSAGFERFSPVTLHKPVVGRPSKQPSMEIQEPTFESPWRGDSPWRGGGPRLRPRPQPRPRPRQPHLSELVRQRTELFVEALQQQNFQTIARLLDNNVNIYYHSLLPHHGRYNGINGFVELLQRGLRVFQPSDIKAEVDSLSEDRLTSILKVTFSGTFLHNGVQFENGRRCVVLKFDALDGDIVKIIMTDEEQDRWVVPYLPRALWAVYNATSEMLRFHSGLENTLDKYYTPDAVLKVNVFPNVMSASEYKGFESINKGYQELMAAVSTTTCPFGVQLSEQTRSLEQNRQQPAPQFRRMALVNQQPGLRDPQQPDRVNETNPNAPNATQPFLPTQPRQPDNQTQPVAPTTPTNVTAPSNGSVVAPEPPRQPDNQTQPVAPSSPANATVPNNGTAIPPASPNNQTSNATKSGMPKEMFDTMQNLHCLMSIEVLGADDNEVYLMKTIRGSDQAIFEHITLDQSGLINRIELTFAEPLKPWDVYRVYKTQPSVQASQPAPAPQQPQPRPRPENL